MSAIKTVSTRALRPASFHKVTLGNAAQNISSTVRKSKPLETIPRPPNAEYIPTINFQNRLEPHQTPFQHTSLPRPWSTPFDQLLHRMTASLRTTESPSLPHLTKLLRSYTSSPYHWRPYAHADPSKQYTRNLVCEVPGLFNLLMLVWTPGKASPVHDHADSHCLMKVLQGELRERRYVIPRHPGREGPLLQTSELRFGCDKVSYMSDKLGLHEISNPSQTEYAVSLHLYTPPNAALRGCHIYDQISGDATHVFQSPYDSVHGVPSARS